MEIKKKTVEITWRLCEICLSYHRCRGVQTIFFFRIKQINFVIHCLNINTTNQRLRIVYATLNGLISMAMRKSFNPIDSGQCDVTCVVCTLDLFVPAPILDLDCLLGQVTLRIIPCLLYAVKL